MPNNTTGADSLLPRNGTDSESPGRATTRNSRHGRASIVVSLVAAAVVIALCFAVWKAYPVSNLLRPDRCTATAKGRSYVLAPDQTQNAALMTRIAQQRGMPARAATIAIATGFQESKLRNINYGDRDSVGLFQQRPSQGWGTETQIMDPVYSINKFYDGLAKIKGYESMEITKAAQKVQRSGYPEAYADHEPEGRAYASALSGYSPKAMTCRLKPLATSNVRPVAEVTATVRDNLARAFNVKPEVSGPVVTIPVPANDSTSGPNMGWALTHYALAHAQTWQIDSVGYDQTLWTRRDSASGWVAASSNDAGNATTIVVTVTAP